MTEKTQNLIFTGLLIAIAIAYYSIWYFGYKKINENEVPNETAKHNTFWGNYARVYGDSAKKVKGTVIK